MPYREKIARLYLLAMTVTYGPYFAWLSTHTPAAEPLPGVHQLSLFGATAVAQMLLIGIGHLYLRSTSRQEARLPLDERDQTIQRRSVNSAYYVLITGMILVGILMPFNRSGWSIINAAIFMIVAAELVHYGIVVFSYRRQA